MQTVIILNVDTESITPISIGKPDTFEPPKNKEEAKEIVINDIKCLTEALCFIVGVADDNQYVNSNEVLTEIIIRLNKELK